MIDWTFIAFYPEDGDSFWVHPDLAIPVAYTEKRKQGSERTMSKWVSLVRMDSNQTPTWIQPGLFGELFKHPEDRGECTE